MAASGHSHGNLPQSAHHVAGSGCDIQHLHWQPSPSLHESHPCSTLSPSNPHLLARVGMQIAGYMTPRRSMHRTHLHIRPQACPCKRLDVRMQDTRGGAAGGAGHSDSGVILARHDVGAGMNHKSTCPSTYGHAILDCNAARQQAHHT